jgi:hypothetical protein
MLAYGRHKPVPKAEFNGIVASKERRLLFRPGGTKLRSGIATIVQFQIQAPVRRHHFGILTWVFSDGKKSNACRLPFYLYGKLPAFEL